MKKILLSFLVLIAFAFTHSNQNYDPSKYKIENVKLSTQEQELYNLIMQYRKKLKLPSIPISPSLTYVAQVHVWDLETNKPETSTCNMHSWSKKGTWSAVCYTDDHKNAAGMWNKPSELTNYNGNGFEISYSQSNGATPQSALEGWKSSSGHNGVIINKGIWSEKWNAIGIGMYGGYAVVWFGNEKDVLILSK